MRRRPDSGVTLAVVLWCLVALGLLSATAATLSRLELALAIAHRDHAASLALAESGMAGALAAVAADPARAGRADSIAGTLETGTYRARWTPVDAGLRVVAEGTSGRASRTIEAWTSGPVSGELRVLAWREVWGEIPE
ncbi:MAG: hypothetical protein R3199_01885 [Gemmatimonadota bacterium]|nr:hypothetical protein [Gemmatimonadota bacterium]